MHLQRKSLYEKLEKARGSKLLVYVTGDRQGLETQISADVLDFLSYHLDSFVDAKGGFPRKISLWLYTRGGHTLVGWNIVNLVRQFCKELEVIVFSKAHSTGTLICLGAEKIVMTKQATLGPIDPSVNSPLNPQMPGAGPQVRVPVSVENVAGYLELAKQECRISSQQFLKDIFLKLSEHVHPLALGDVFRARGQIQMLADKLLSKTNSSVGSKQKKRIIEVLCREAGSHDFTIARREARKDFGLNIETPSMELYSLLKEIHSDISGELELNSVYNPVTYLGLNANRAYSFKRCILESVSGGSHKFITEGQLSKAQTPQGENLRDQRTYDGWREDTN